MEQLADSRHPRGTPVSVSLRAAAAAKVSTDADSVRAARPTIARCRCVSVTQNVRSAGVPPFGSFAGDGLEGLFEQRASRAGSDHEREDRAGLANRAHSALRFSPALGEGLGFPFLRNVGHFRLGLCDL